MMGNIQIRPDFRTSGGEMNDIMIEGVYAGSMSLVYREGKRLAGSIQLDHTALKQKAKDAVVKEVTEYVQALIDAYDIEECSVIVTHSDVDHVIATGQNVGVIEDIIDEHGMEATLDQTEHSKARTSRARKQDMQYLELVIVGEHRNAIEYHIHDRKKQMLAEVFVSILDRDVVGEVNWQYEPSEEDIENATDLLVSDFNENEIDTFVLEMKYNEELLEIVELAHDDFFANDVGDEMESSDQFSVILTRDDGDALTYEIYDQTRGGLPVATATIDISHRELSGFIDFREEEEDEDDREEMALMLMRELDKEKDYKKLGLTMMHNNQWIDEVVFEQQTIQ